MEATFSGRTRRHDSGVVRLALGLAAVLCACLALGSATALAGEAHPFAFSFGSFSNPNGIAIDESTGDVYVADIGTATVYKFDAHGNAVDFSSLASNALNGTSTPAGSFSFPSDKGNPAAIAVDNSTSPDDPSAGDLYVLDAGHGVIDKFSPEGTYIGQINGPLSGQRLFGLGMDGSGELRVSTEVSSEGRVDLFNNAAENAFVKALEFSKNGGLGEETKEYAFAVSPTGDMYTLSACGCFRKRGANMDTLGQVDSGPSDIAAAVDWMTGHVYVDDQSSVSEWDTGEMNGPQFKERASGEVGSSALSSTFGSAQLFGLSSEQGGIAVNGASGNIYVSNPADGKVYVYAADVPAVAAGMATSVAETAATLHGTVDPRGVAVTSCQFEYEAVSSLTITAPVSSYGHSLPCDQTAAQIGSGTGPVPVTAEISALAPGKLYDFRLVAGDASGTNSSSGRVATVGPGFGIKHFDVSFLNSDGTPDTQAGSHPYKMVTSIDLNTKVIPVEKAADSRYMTEPDGSAQNIITDLPPGLVGDPNATAVKCTLAQLEPRTGENSGAGRCPPESQVGELEVEFGETFEGAIDEPVYNMVPPPGVAAQIGANFVHPAVFVNVGVQAGGDYPLRATSLQISGIAPIIATRFTIFGVVGKLEEVGREKERDSRKPFLTLPTGCAGPLRSSISANSYQDPGHLVEASTLTHGVSGQPVGLSGCSKLLFPPTITVSPDTTDASTSSGLTVGVHVSQKAAFNPEGLAESALRDTTVTLPEGVALNPAGADGLEACSEGLAGFTGFTEFDSEFEPGVRTATFTPENPSPTLPGTNFCPDGSKIGTVKIKTPLLEHELEGAVYLASQNSNPFGSLVAMYMFVEDPVSGSLVKLTGEVKLSDTGQIVTTFKNTPDLPFENLELHFFGGERAPLTTPSRCGTYTTQATFVPWDGNGPVNTSSSFQITSGPNGSPCPGASLPFNPSLTAGMTSIQAGGFSPFTMTMSREDGQQNLQAISLKMPPGLSGLLTGIELCGEAQANAGTCGQNSQIGETIVSVGVGNDPFSVTGGKVYLTGPYKGAPFGLSIVNPAKAGPYDLGQVIVRAKIEVDPVTADLTVTSDNEGPHKIPTIIDGIPLQIKHVNVTINRPSFTFNPTDCNPMSITGSLDSTEGETAVVSLPFQATNCAVLGFKPGFKASTSSKTSRADGASLSVKLTYPKAPFGTQENVKSVKVDLPRQLPSRLTTLQKACPDSTFNANPAACPPASRVASARALTPLIPVPLEGPGYFVSHGGAKFPELVVVLQGYGVTLDLHGETFINKAGITSSTFRTVPDAPVGTFELTLPEGPDSALAANGNLCTTNLQMPTTFVAQNGMKIDQMTPISVSGCKPAIRVLGHSVKGSHASIRVSVPAAGTLVATGGYIKRSVGNVAKAGSVTISVSLTGKGQRVLAKNPHQRVNANVKLRFSPKHGAPLTAYVRLLIG